MTYCLSYWKLTRASMALIAVAAMLCGVLLSGMPISFARVLIGTIVVFCMTGGGFALNDVIDLERDILNSPTRPIPAGQVSSRNAARFAVLLLQVGLLTSLLLPPKPAIIAVLVGVVLMEYSSIKVRAPIVANLITAIMSALSCIFGALLMGRIGLSWYPALLALLAIFGREIAKDMYDEIGDRRVGLRTLPVVWGTRRSLAIVTIAFGLALLVMPLPYITHDMATLYLYATVAVAGMVMAILVRLWIRVDRKAIKLFLDVSGIALLLSVGAVIGGAAVR